MRASAIEVSTAGISRTGRRARVMAASEVRRLYVYTDANGDECLVARGPRLRLQFISRRELLDPAVRVGVTALVAAVRAQAQVDQSVTEYLTALGAA